MPEQIRTSQLKKWCIAGFIAIVILGVLLHFVYDWSNQNYLIGAFVPVNESVWEHFKLGLWGVIMFSLLEYFAIRKTASNYFFAKATGVFIIDFTIILVHYTYSEFYDHNILFVDIVSYVIGVFLCQWFCFRIFQSVHKKSLNVAGLILLITVCIIFIICTYLPPHLEIFKDIRNNTYGVEVRK